MKQQEYFLYAKKIKIITFYNNSSPLCLSSSAKHHFEYYPSNASSVRSFASASMQGCVFYVYLRFDFNKNSASIYELNQLKRSTHIAFICNFQLLHSYSPSFMKTAPVKTDNGSFSIISLTECQEALSEGQFGKQKCDIYFV